MVNARLPCIRESKWRTDVAQSRHGTAAGGHRCCGGGRLLRYGRRGCGECVLLVASAAPLGRRGLLSACARAPVRAAEGGGAQRQLLTARLALQLLLAGAVRWSPEEWYR